MSRWRGKNQGSPKDRKAKQSSVSAAAKSVVLRRLGDPWFSSSSAPAEPRASHRRSRGGGQIWMLLVLLFLLPIVATRSCLAQDHVSKAGRRRLK